MPLSPPQMKNYWCVSASQHVVILLEFAFVYKKELHFIWVKLV